MLSGANLNAPLEVPISVTSWYWGSVLWSRGKDCYPPEGYRQVLHPPGAGHGSKSCGEAGWPEQNQHLLVTPTTLRLLIPSKTDIFICSPLTFTDRIVFLSFYDFLFIVLKVSDYAQKKFAELGSPNKMKLSMGHGARAWVSDFNHPHYMAGRKAMKTGTGSRRWCSEHETTQRLIWFIIFNLPPSCCVPQFSVWNRIWLVRVAAFQSLWPSRRPQDATSCCFQLDHLTMELTPRMKSSTGMWLLTTFNMTLILTQIIFLDFDSKFFILYIWFIHPRIFFFPAICCNNSETQPLILL